MLTSITRIRAVTFDAGGTLIAPWPSVGHVYAEVAGCHGHQLNPEELNRRFKAAWGAKLGFDYSRAAWRTLVEHTLDSLITLAQVEALFPALYEQFKEPGVWTIFPDVRPALAQLRASGLKLGLISNWDERLRPLLQRLSLSSSFDALAISAEIGHTKPAREVFAAAAGQLGVPPEEILHVGDSEVEDQQGATVAGFQALLLDRRSRETGEGTISGLSELTRFLRPDPNGGSR